MERPGPWLKWQVVHEHDQLVLWTVRTNPGVEAPVSGCALCSITWSLVFEAGGVIQAV